MSLLVHVPVDAETESFGQVYIEAMAAGVPSVFTPSGIAAELLSHLENAYVVPFRNSDAIYEGMKAILADRELRRKLIANGIEAVQGFSMDKQIAELNSCYTRPIGQKDGLNNC
jgi:glycosyltransferase involved in cell wall biosynthesis